MCRAAVELLSRQRELVIAGHSYEEARHLARAIARLSELGKVGMGPDEARRVVALEQEHGLFRA